MRAIGMIGVGAILASTALSSPALSASETDKAQVIGKLLAQVCLPVLEDGRNEEDVARAAGLHRIHQIWFPQPPPRGLRQYAGIAVVNITDDTCSLHADTEDFPVYLSTVQQVLASRREPWAAISTPADGQQHIFCDPTGGVAVKTFEGDPTRFPAFKALHIRSSFEVTVTTRGLACHAIGAPDHQGQP